MYGRIFSVFLNSLSESYKLEKRYRLTTTLLGWITVVISCLGVLAIMYVTRLMLGIPLEGGPIEGMRLKLIAWIVLIIVLVPIVFYAGTVLVYGVYGSSMLIVGRFTWQQAVDFAWSAKYPEHWYKSKA